MSKPIYEWIEGTDEVLIRVNDGIVMIPYWTLDAVYWHARSERIRALMDGHDVGGAIGSSVTQDYPPYGSDGE